MEKLSKDYSSNIKFNRNNTGTAFKLIKHAILFFLFLFFMGASSNAQQSLQDLINYALEHSHDIKKAALQQDEAHYKYRETLGQALPQIEGSGSYTKMGLGDLSELAGIAAMLPEDQAPAVEQMLGGLDNLYSTSLGVQITQVIYSRALWVGLDLTKKTKQLYDILKQQSDEELISEVASNYFQAGSLMMQFETLKKSKENLENLFRVVELSYQNDMVTETEMNRVKVSMINLESSLKTVENAIGIQKNYLRALAGMEADAAITIDTASIVNAFKLRKETGFDLGNVSAYKALMMQDELYAGQVKSAQAEYFPTLAAFAQLDYSSYGTEASPDNFRNMNTIGLNLSIPIFTSGSNYAKVKQKKLQRAQLQEDIEKNKQLLSIEYSSAVSDYQTAASLLLVQKDNRDLAQKVYNQTLMQYEEGMASLADLLNVNNDFLQADNSYNQQLLKCKTAEVRMLKASGNIKSLTE